MKRVFAVATLLTLFSSLAACTGEIDAGESAATETPYALGNPDLRIAVIGAGPSGLTAAYTLKRLGYQHVTVFEKDDHVGGKVNTLHLGDFSVELGAVFASPDYQLTLQLAQEYGIPYTTYSKPTYILDEHGVKQTFETFLTSRYSLDEIQTAVRNYAIALQSFPQIFQDSMANLPPDLYLNMNDFAAKYGFTPVAELARSLVVGFGYGYYETAPAAYLMKIMAMLIKVGPTGLSSPPYYTWPTGFQSLWQAVASELDVRLNSKITSVKRSSGSGPLKLVVNYNIFAPQEFDRVIVSAPLNRVKDFVSLTDAEKALFAKVESERYFVTLFSAAGLQGGESVFVYPNSFPQQMNHVNVWASPTSDLPVYIAYQIADSSIWGIDLLTKLAADIYSLGNHAVFLTPIVQKEWDYFPHVNSAAIASHFYEDVEALQGQKGLFYVGGTLSFETVETSARYARSLVQRYFPATAVVSP
jgi:protoporphyrinogen/coproporphyrinogen III oxidase